MTILRPYIVAVLCLLLPSLAVGQNRTSSRTDIREQLGEAVRNGDVALVEKLSATILRSQPNDARVLLLRANARLSANNLPGALVDINAAVAADPSLLPAWMLQAEVLQRSNRAEEARAVLTDARKLFPDSEIPSVALGLSWARSGDCEQATFALEDALTRKPDNVSAILQLSQCYLRLDRSDEAIDLLSRTFEVRPQDVTVGIALGDALVAGHHFDSAASVLQTLRKQHPARYEIDGLYATALEGQGRSDSALVVLEELTRRLPKDAAAWSGFGLMAARAGKLDTAARALKRSVEIDPRNAPTWFELGVVQHERGFHDEAIQAFRRVTLSAKDGAPLAYDNIALVYRSQRSYDDAIRAHQQAIKLDSSSARFVASYGLTLHTAERHNEALEILESANQRWPSDVDVLFALTRVYIHVGKTELAKALIERIDKVRPDLAKELRSNMKTY